MPANVLTAPNFLADTDYPFDKVIYYISGSFITPSPGLITIPHGLSFKPLPYAQWSLASDMSTPQEMSMGFSDMYDPVNFPYVSAVYADATNIYVSVSYFGVGTPTIYFRVYCFEPTNSGNPIITSTSSVAQNNFLLDTDLNYMKLLASDRLVVSSAPVSIAHNLGYVPTVLVWEEDNQLSVGSVHPPFGVVIFQDPAFLVSAFYGPAVVDTTNLTFVKNNTYHYRIYVDT